MTDHPTAPATWDDVTAEAFRVTVDRAARGVASQDECALLRQHTELLLADLARYEEVVGELNESNINLARDLARARRELADRDAAESADAAAGSYAGRAEHAEETITRVSALYERWVKAGPPPLGTSMSRWWDRRLVELHNAIRTPAEQSARTIVKNPSALRDPIAAALYERERPPRDPHWADAYPADREVFESMADAVLASLQPRLAALAEYENAITWHTDCLNCARVMNSAYAETMRAEKAEAAVREVLGVLRPVHAGDEIIGYEPPLPIEAAAVDWWWAVLDSVPTGMDAASPVLRDPCPYCESSSDRVPRAGMGQHIADMHPEVKGAGA